MRKTKRLTLITVAMLLACGIQSSFAQQKEQKKWRNLWFRDSVMISDIPYTCMDNPRQMLDLILPTKSGDKSLPVIVFIHGGGWRRGNKKVGILRISDFVASGKYAGVLVGYRTSGEAKWPNQIHDCKAAIRWIRANATKYGIDANRIAVWGSSAGGHLAAMLGTSGDDLKMDGTLGSHNNVSSRVTCVVDFYGPIDFLKMNRTAIKGAKIDHDAPDSPESLLIGGPIQENIAKVATANPITYVTSDDPPFLIVHGTKDPMVPFKQSELLHAALKRANVTSTLIAIEGAGHGTRFGPVVNRFVEKFFDHHLHGVEVKWADRSIKASSIFNADDQGH